MAEKSDSESKEMNSPEGGSEKVIMETETEEQPSEATIEDKKNHKRL